MRKVILLVMLILAGLALAEFWFFPNFYSTLICVIILLSLGFIYYHLLGDRKREKEQSDYMHMILHELKSPLSAMKLSLKMLLDGSFGTLNYDQRNILEETEKKNEMAISLVGDITDYSRAASTTKFSKSATNMSQLIDEVVLQNKKELLAKRMRFSFTSAAPQVPEVWVDREKMKLVIKNLLENALHYTAMAGHITIAISADKKYFQFKIQDSGIGIPENQKQKIFSKFFRATNAIKTEVPGSGLGLFIVKKIVEGHGGKVWFESKEHEGSTFYFQIPL